jgi:hypothetical protein
VQAHIVPNRIGQTIGDDPRSKGYHRQDGIWNGEPYCAAVDLGVNDLSPAKRTDLLELRLMKVSLPGIGAALAGASMNTFMLRMRAAMKPQLREQVRKWNRERAESGHKSLLWQENGVGFGGKRI